MFHATRRVVLAAALGVLAAGAARADPVLQFSGDATLTASSPLTLGWSFTTNQAVTVTALDDWINSLNAGPAQVRLYDGMGNVLASATVSTADPLEGTAPALFYAHALATPVALAANTTYYIAADFLPGDAVAILATGLTVDPRITYGGGVSALGTGGTPTTDLSGGNANPAYFGPNFDLGSPVAVPEPATLAPALTGVVLLLGYAWRRRGRAG